MTTYTLAILAILGVSKAAFDEISAKLRAAGDYDHVFLPDGTIDMTHIALQDEEAAAEVERERGRERARQQIADAIAQAIRERGKEPPFDLGRVVIGLQSCHACDKPHEDLVPQRASVGAQFVTFAVECPDTRVGMNIGFGTDGSWWARGYSLSELPPAPA